MTWLGDQLGRIADDMPERDLATRVIEIHQRRRRNVMALAAAAVVVVTVLAATVGIRALPAEPRPAARPSAPPEQSTIQVGVVPSVESAPVFVALVNGYFKEEGLTVEPVITTGPVTSTYEVDREELDLAQTDYTTVFRLNELGKELKIVSSLYQAAPGSFAIVANTKSKIRTVADLKRKKVAVPNLGGLQSLALTVVLKRAGLTLQDIVQVERPYPEMANAMATGMADAALLPEPYVTASRTVKHTRIVADVMTRELANLHTAGMTATSEWIRQNPRTLAAFQRALAKAQRLIASDTQQVRDALPRYMKVSGAVTAGVALGSYPAKLNLAELQRLADLAYAHKFLKRPADVANAVAQGG